MSDPAEDLPTDRQFQRSDGDFELETLGLGMIGWVLHDRIDLKRQPSDKDRAGTRARATRVR